MTALIVIGSILLVLFLLAMLNLKFYVRYEGEEVTLKFGVLCFWKQLVPYAEEDQKQRPASDSQKTKHKKKPPSHAAKKGKTKPPKPSGKAADGKKAQKDHPSVKQDWKETAKTAYDIIRSVLRPTRFILRNIRITGLRLHAVIGGEEPDETAVRFGHWNAAVYGALATIRNFMKVDAERIMIAVDFTSPETEFRIDGTVKVRVFVAVISLVRMLWHILVNTLKRRKEEQEPPRQAAVQA